MSRAARTALIEREHDRLSLARQCDWVSISRSSYAPAGESADNKRLMRVIDAQYLETPWYGSRQMTRHLRRHGHRVNRKRVRRLMRLMGLAGIAAEHINARSRPCRGSVPAAQRGDHAR